MSVSLNIKLLHNAAQVPTKNNPTDAGFDLYSIEDLVIVSGERKIISLGIASEISEGYFVLVRDRSGLAAKHGIYTLAGVIDSDYRGEWKVVLVNLGNEDYPIKKGDRIAQAVIHKIPEVTITQVKELEETKRSDSGFGQSGR